MLQLKPEVKVLGLKQTFTLTISDDDSGLSQVTVWLHQEGNRKEVLSQTFPGQRWARGGRERQVEIPLTLEVKAWGFQEGPAILTVEARDYSLMGWLRGNRAELVWPLTIDLTPLRLTFTSINEILNQGGTGLVTYQVNKPTAKTGLLVNGVFFPGYAVGKEAGRYLAFFAVPYDLPQPLSLELLAVDLGGVEVKQKLWYRLRPKKWKVDTLHLSDDFLQRKMAEFQEMNPQLKSLTEPLAVFLQINQAERLQNDRMVVEICQTSQAEPMWQGAFYRLPNSKPMASFADHRTYKYQGREIDRQVHLGQDLASLERAEVPAGNTGIVVFTGPLGIYGQSVIIDHGLGVFSLYSHLSEIGVEKGQKLQKGDILGRTGATGMAGGDHLHFAVMIHGHPVNPLEWWDAHWLKDQVYRQFAIVGLSHPPATTAAAPAASESTAPSAPGQKKKKRR
ncbi:MAG: M23 family metallopeptidase [Desulfobacca sp.]|uniref:M23 family metallopeptidase n=1 Tax=Desulfobacca sp. TaxID=2067990 RepID=UPI00404B5259